MLSSALLPGFLAASETSVSVTPPSASTMTCGSVALSYWGRAPVETVPGESTTIVLSGVVRRTGGCVKHAQVSREMTSNPSGLIDLLPPFGAVAGDAAGVRFVADSMGFEQLFHLRTATGAVGSTSALLIGGTTGAALDAAAVGVQSLLGWQLGQRTLFEGVHKLAAGAVAHIGGSGLTISHPPADPAGAVERAEAVDQAAAILRRSLNAVLDDHPDAVLQLTGGMDSRLLLSAIPANRRRGLHAMTLDVPGGGDVKIARALAEQFGLTHEVHGLADIADIEPAAAWEACRAEATRLDAMADPVALAAQRIAERSFPQGVRISGLGGEIARGFYYLGSVRERTYTRKDAQRLADWRMFVNDAVEPGLLVADFVDQAHEDAVDAVFEALSGGGAEWFRATDHLYLRHRMQRWAGATDVAVSGERLVINPMLDRDFLALVGRLRPQDKANSRFLAELQMALDVELASIRLDGRQAPVSYANPPEWERYARAFRTAQRLAKKAVQRVQRGNRPPAGGEILAGKVARHWRNAPHTVAGLAALPFISQEWVGSMLDGSVHPRPSSVAFLTNLLVATGADT